MDSADKIKIEVALATAAELAARAIDATDEATRQSLIVKFMTILKPLSPANKGIPKASFMIGVLANKMALITLDSQQMGEDERVQTAVEFTKKAAEYFEIAAVMKEDGHFTPARALDSLAKLHEDGVLGDKDPKTAFDLRLRAANMGWAEAQYSLVIMYAKGEGTEPSSVQAHHWMEQAWKNRQHLSPQTQTELEADLASITAEITQAQPARPANDQAKPAAAVAGAQPPQPGPGSGS